MATTIGVTDALLFYSSLAASKNRHPAGFYLTFMTQYERLLAATDYVSGMTDRFAVQLFQRLSGIRLSE